MRGNPKTGAIVQCAICSAEVYRKGYRLKRSLLHFCGQACRLEAISRNLIDRKCREAKAHLRTGETFKCPFCGTEKYQKRSHADRGVNKTCGSPRCFSAYLRSRWGLPPFTDEERALKKARPMAIRATNFTATQRAKWIDTACAYCGAVDNLHLDHIVPVCAGGRSTRENAQTLCGRCNLRKREEVDRPLSQGATS